MCIYIHIHTPARVTRPDTQRCDAGLAFPVRTKHRVERFNYVDVYGYLYMNLPLSMYIYMCVCVCVYI